MPPLLEHYVADDWQNPGKRKVNDVSQQLSSKNAEMIVEAANRLCDYVGSGMSELDAGVKVAKEYNLTPGQIKLAVWSYNPALQIAIESSRTTSARCSKSALVSIRTT